MSHKRLGKQKHAAILSLKSVEKDDLVPHESYVIFADYEGFDLFVWACYKGDGTFAVDGGPDIDAESVTMAFEKPRGMDISFLPGWRP